MARFTKKRLRGMANSKKTPPGIKKWARKRLSALNKATRSRSKPKRRKIRRKAPKRRTKTKTTRKRKNIKRRAPKRRNMGNGRLSKNMEDVAMILGGATSDIVSRGVNQLFSNFGLNLTDEVAGGLAAWWGEGQVKGFAKPYLRGVKNQSASRFIGANIGSSLGGLFGGTGGGGNGGGVGVG